jgi:hypothetical protein
LSNLFLSFSLNLVLQGQACASGDEPEVSHVNEPCKQPIPSEHKPQSSIQQVRSKSLLVWAEVSEGAAVGRFLMISLVYKAKITQKYVVGKRSEGLLKFEEKEPVAGAKMHFPCSREFPQRMRSNYKFSVDPISVQSWCSTL